VSDGNSRPAREITDGMLSVTTHSVAATLDVEGVVRTHAPYVVRTLRHLGVAERDLDDVAQEVFLVLHRRRQAWDPARGALRTWLYGICLRHALHHRRHRHRHPVDPTDPGQLDAARDDRTEVARDARWLARWVLEQLDDDKRAVFVLFEIEGLTMDEVVAVVGCPLKTGYSRLHAARTIVREAHQRARERGWT
jgi:RNA polymerase sigma-70 factor, ECF subfamily